MRSPRRVTLSLTASTLLVSTVLGGALVAPAEAASSKIATGKIVTPVVVPTVCYTMPDAASLTTQRGRTVNTLFPYQGSVFYGYGDYGANTGSMTEPYGTNISSFDVITGASQVHLPGFKTEEVNVFRSFDGEIFAPSIDPSLGADGTNSFASNAGQVWSENSGAAGPVHVYDVAKAGGQLFVAGSESIPSPDGSSYGAATVWRSTDAGVTWAVAQSETEADVSKRNGYERYYWMGVIGTKVYTRATLNSYPDVPPMRVLDTTTNTWSTVPDSGATFGTGVTEADGVVSWQGRLWSTQGALLSFDGVRTTTIGLKSGTLNLRVLSIGDDGLLYAYDGVTGAVYRVGPTRTSYSLTKVATVAPGAASFTVAGGKVWAGAVGTAQVCSSALS